MLPPLLFTLFTVLMDSTVSVPQSHWIAISVNIAKPRTVIECSVSSENASTIDTLLMTRPDALRFNRGRSFHPLYSTGFQSSAHFRHEVDQPGEYILMLDNRLEGRGPTPVRVRIELWNPDLSNVTTVPAARRALIVTLSLLFFALVAAFSISRFRARRG